MPVRVETIGMLGGGVCQLGCDLAELGEHGLHVSGVEGVADGQTLRLTALRGEVRSEGVDGRLVTGDDDGGRSIDGGDVDAVDQLGADLVLGGLDGGHCAAGG
ncbi:hypothetical protein GCM10020000_52790 [Streptomyces olivoverticillatus]